jgi:uncharacterized protein
VTSGINARALVEGSASGAILRIEEPLSFWGGLDPETGEIIEPRNHRFGAVVSGRILAMPSAKGSSSSSSVLAEAIRTGTAPAGIVMTVPDGIVALGSIVAAELYGTVTPVIIVPSESFATIPDGVEASIEGAHLSW